MIVNVIWTEQDIRAMLIRNLKSTNPEIFVDKAAAENIDVSFKSGGDFHRTIEIRAEITEFLGIPKEGEDE